MIKFTLKCAQDHRFDSWFQSASAFDKLARRGLIRCALCGDTDIKKSVMAPNVQSGRTLPPGLGTSGSNRYSTDAGKLSTPSSLIEQALAEMRREIEANSESVGTRFARVARQIHNGEAPARPIHGEARLDEARALIEDGVPILPLPFRPRRKLN